MKHLPLTWAHITRKQAAVCCVLAALLALGAGADGVEYAHGTSYLEPLKYDTDFTHFDYVDPDAPKGGLIRASVMGTFDSFNGILDKGRVAEGVLRLGPRALIYDRLLEQAADEPASHYGRLAEGVWVADDLKQFAFKIRDGAFWHDGTPLTAADVVFTFETLRDKGAAGVRTALMELGSIEQIGDDEVLFTVKPDRPANADLIYSIGGYSILPKHYWERATSPKRPSSRHWAAVRIAWVSSNSVAKSFWSAWTTIGASNCRSIGAGTTSIRSSSTTSATNRSCWSRRKAMSSTFARRRSRRTG